MEAKDKAVELVNKFYSQLSGVPLSYLETMQPLSVDSTYKEAKQCALIAVDEKINLIREIVILCDLEENQEISKIYRNLHSVKSQIELI